MVRRSRSGECRAPRFEIGVSRSAVQGRQDGPTPLSRRHEVVLHRRAPLVSAVAVFDGQKAIVSKRIYHDAVDASNLLLTTLRKATKNVQKHVFDTIIAWRTSHSSLSGWICLEFLNPGSISVFEVFALHNFSRADDYETPSRPKLPPFGQSDALVHLSDRVVPEQPDSGARVDFDAGEGPPFGGERMDASESSVESAERGLALICSTISE